ncbi:MAG: radical SAM family heme chaperone HemW [Bacteroidales bacterium]|nr:radical SAM family heme chaperone HemW [Bacteroidales bacterium]
MAGIYIHIPFCRQKCHYCNFYSLASLKHKENVLRALLQEIILQKNYLDGEEVETIYFGGGTPSLLSAGEISQIHKQLSEHFQISPHAEITLEANPDDLTKDKIRELKNTCVNRLSIGVQSFLQEDLVYLHRVHSAQQSANAVRLVQDSGFENISIDLIYGVPTLPDVFWRKNLEVFSSLNIPHLSAYALTVEPKTALDVLIRKKKKKAVDDEKTAGQFSILMDFARHRQLEHYEISNFCKKGFYSKHNLSYWQGKKYLGLGPSAHSYNGVSRQWNVARIVAYVSSLEKNLIPDETEILDVEQKYNEYVMVSLRTMWGVDMAYIEQHFGIRFKNHFLDSVQNYLKGQKMIREDTIFRLSDKGKLYADGIAADLFL